MLWEEKGAAAVAAAEGWADGKNKIKRAWLAGKLELGLSRARALPQPSLPLQHTCLRCPARAPHWPRQGKGPPIPGVSPGFSAHLLGFFFSQTTPPRRLLLTPCGPLAGGCIRTTFTEAPERWAESPSVGVGRIQKVERIE